MYQLEDSCERDRRSIEWNEEYSEDLADVDVEYETFLIKCCTVLHISLTQMQYSSQVMLIPTELILMSMCGLKILYHWKTLRIASRLPRTEQKGCLKEAFGRK